MDKSDIFPRHFRRVLLFFCGTYNLCNHWIISASCGCRQENLDFSFSFNSHDFSFFPFSPPLSLILFISIHSLYQIMSFTITFSCMIIMCFEHTNTPLPSPDSSDYQLRSYKIFLRLILLLFCPPFSLHSSFLKLQVYYTQALKTSDRATITLQFTHSDSDFSPGSGYHVFHFLFCEPSS